MKKLFALILVMLIIGISANASHSAQYWAKTYGGSYVDGANFIQQTSEGGYIVAGGSDFFGNGNDDFLVLKLDCNGNILWQKTYGGSESLSSAYAIHETRDRGYIVAGYIMFSADYYDDFWILKIDSNGESLWQKTYGGRNYDNPFSVQQTSDGGYIVAGRTNSFGSGDFDIWILKLNANGNVTWQKAYGGVNWDEARSIEQTPDGGYIVAGYTESFGVGGFDLWIIKLDSDGNISWQKTYGGILGDRANSIQQTTDGGYVIAGYTNSFRAGGEKLLVAKLNSNGDICWQKSYGERGLTYASFVKQSSDGGYVVAGYTDYFGVGSKDFSLLKLNYSGNITWQKTYGTLYRDEALSIVHTLDGGYVIAGFSLNNSDALILKVDRIGEIPGCDIISNSNAVAYDTNLQIQGSNGIIQPTSATITNTNIIPQDISLEITTICEGDYCPTETIYGEHSAETELLRYFRDEILSQTPEGQEIIRLYYKWSPVIVQVMEEDEAFKEEVKEMADGVLELIGGGVE